MRYISGLISQNKRVFPEYFKGTQSPVDRDSKAIKFLSSSIAVLSFFVGLLLLHHPILFLLFEVIAIILFPPSRQRIENIIALRLTAIMRVVLVCAVFISMFPLIIHYNKLDEEQAARDKIESEHRLQKAKIAEAEKVRLEKVEQTRKDTVNLLIQDVRNLLSKKRFEAAEKRLELASTKSLRQDEYLEISQIRHDLNSKRTETLVQAGRFRDALPFLNRLLDENGSDNQYLYYRGLCYSKIGNMPMAVADLQSALSNGNSKAKLLYEQINPIRRRVAYYVTRCCDGSTSNAKGRGACSHHNGVCNWNDPVYEEYRKY